METIYKVLIACVLGLFILGSGIAMIISFTDEEAANQYLESVAKVIVESNYNDEVINACIDEATKNGYELKVTVEGSQQAGQIKYAQLEFTYKLTIKLFHIEQEKTKIKIV